VDEEAMVLWGLPHQKQTNNSGYYSGLG